MIVTRCQMIVTRCQHSFNILSDMAPVKLGVPQDSCIIIFMLMIHYYHGRLDNLSPLKDNFNRIVNWLNREITLSFSKA